MILELSKSDQRWFSIFLENYSYMIKTHVLNGTRLDEEIKEKISEIINYTPEKSGYTLIPITQEEAMFFINLLEENTCACPACNLSSLKHRKSVTNKMYKLINEDVEP